MSASEMVTTALAQPGLSREMRTFLLDVQRQAARRPLSPRQIQALDRICSSSPRIDFAAVNRVALVNLPAVLARLLPGGKTCGSQYRTAGLRGGQGGSLAVKLWGESAGAWCDFATGDKGGDPVSLAAAVARISQSEAARQLARMLGMKASSDDQ